MGQGWSQTTSQALEFLEQAFSVSLMLHTHPLDTVRALASAPHPSTLAGTHCSTHGSQLTFQISCLDLAKTFALLFNPQLRPLFPGKTEKSILY